ncbi:MAG: protein phosphatase 2C domain-containing protein [Polyangiaceae bacterium]|nr:protein phosphatase 2C domain-containing protein [Polyangiaceae bacterium]
MSDLGEADLEMRSYGATHVGMRRQMNEDAFLRDDDLGLWVVADGMGGHAAGEVASQEAIDAIYAMVKHGKGSLHLNALSPGDLLRSASRLLEGAVQSATYMVFGLAQMDVGRVGMGTTISSMFRCGRSMIVGQVGDSRIYRVRGQEVLQLTEDHTLVAWQLKRGLITEEEAKVSRQRNVITRAVGNRDYVQVDIVVTEAELGDQYLLCSDGLHGYLNVSEIAEIASMGGQNAVERFIELANARGGKDNITAILIETS